jgi:HPt (histidine-containing phosphotransfer) domain-containing protein
MKHEFARFEAQAPESAAPVFDHKELVRRLGGNGELARAVAEAFLEAAPKQLANLRRHLIARDAQAGRREAHTMKGAAANTSAPAFRALALEAEQAAGAGEWNKLEELAPRMEDQLDRVRIAVDAWSN